MSLSGVQLCDPMDCSSPGSSHHGISQARILEWVAISLSGGSSWPRGWTLVSCIGRRILYHWATWKALFRCAILLFIFCLSYWFLFHYCSFLAFLGLIGKNFYWLLSFSLAIPLYSFLGIIIYILTCSLSLAFLRIWWFTFLFSHMYFEEIQRRKVIYAYPHNYHF